MREGIRREQRAINGEVLVRCTLGENTWQPCVLSTSNILQNSLRGMLDLDYSTNFRSRLHCFFFHSGTRTV